MTSSKPRRPASSRGGTSRPRRLAGQQSTAQPADDAVEPLDGEQPVEDVPSPVDVETEPAAVETVETGPVDDEPAKVEEKPAGAVPPEEPASARFPALAGPGTTRGLTIAVGIVALILVLEAAWFAVHALRDSPQADAPPSGTISVPSDRPVIASSVAVQEGVDEAAVAAQKIVGRSYETYDKDVDAAVKLMTPDYAADFKSTTDDVRGEFIRRKTTVQARVVGQGVVRANDTEVQALIFLNEYVSRGSGKDAKTVYTQYRALLTMVHTDKGWLVDGLDTK